MNVGDTVYFFDADHQIVAGRVDHIICDVMGCGVALLKTEAGEVYVQPVDWIHADRRDAVKKLLCHLEERLQEARAKMAESEREIERLRERVMVIQRELEGLR